MTEQKLGILQHALGLDQHGRGEAYRNQFCAGGDDEKLCRELIEDGYMVQHPTTDWLPYFNCSVTEVGKEAVRAESPLPPKLSRSQRNYRAFLDADAGMTFFEWLKLPRLAATKEASNG